MIYDWVKTERWWEGEMCWRSQNFLRAPGSVFYVLNMRVAYCFYIRQYDIK